MASNVLGLGLRGLQFLWTLLIMALVGHMIATSTAGDPSIVNFDMFVAVFAMLSLLYLVTTSLRDGFGVPIVTTALDALNTLFFLCAAIATAAYLGAHSCSNPDYTRNNIVTNGSPNTAARCREAQASTTFLWFGFACFAASTIFSVLGGGSSVSMRGGVGGVRRGGPSMSQV